MYIEFLSIYYLEHNVLCSVPLFVQCMYALFVQQFD